MRRLITTSLVEELLAIADDTSCRDFLAENACRFSEEDLQKLKTIADHYLRADLDHYLAIGDMLLYLANVSENAVAQALGLLIHANACAVGGLGEYARAVDLYEHAASIYASLNRPADQARSQVGKVLALTHLGRHLEAESTAQWAGQILEDHHEWLPLAKMVSNLGISYSRQGDDQQSLAMFDRARQYCMNLDTEPNPFLPNVEHNRSIALRDLGRYEESIAASQKARELHLHMENSVEAARALQSLATTYFVLGKYNEALAHLDRVKQEFMDDGRMRDVMRAELYMVDCLVQLRRFGAVLEKCAKIRQLFDASGAKYEVAQTILFEAVAYTGLRRYTEAWDTLEEASTLFHTEGNHVGTATIRLRQSHLLYLQKRYEESASLAATCIDAFVALDRSVDAAFARVVQARSLIMIDHVDAAQNLLVEACTLGKQKNIPALCQQCHHLLGIVAAQRENSTQALTEFDQAIEALELLRGQLMVEFRAGYLEDKEAVYADAVQVCIDSGKTGQALMYVEQAKSRALIDLLAQQLDLRLHARAPADKPLLDELTRLRSERDRLYRRWDGSDEKRDALLSAGDIAYMDAPAAVINVEGRITELWHALLIRNADYAQDAALWRTRAEPFQQLLAEDCILLEYYIAHSQLLVFLITHDEVQVQPLHTDPDEIRRLLELLRLHMTMVPSMRSPKQVFSLTAQDQKILNRLYGYLIRPVIERLSAYRRLMIVPHSMLHYLPFHALMVEGRYLLEDFEISYLPSASFLPYCNRTRTGRGRLLALGHSYGEALPHAPDEAVAVANLMNGIALIDDQATKANFARFSAEAGILHFATHAEFRADNPLFSGLHLDDGWLTTLDIFDLSLSASLVTLSACQTGRNVIGGGDELLGLMRAFLSAGVDSLVLSYWHVEDSSTARVMQDFYARLADGDSKTAALRAAQLNLLQQGQTATGEHEETQIYAHPYFWAPFFLVGDTEALPPG